MKIGSALGQRQSKINFRWHPDKVSKVVLLLSPALLPTANIITTGVVTASPMDQGRNDPHCSVSMFRLESNARSVLDGRRWHRHSRPSAPAPGPLASEAPCFFVAAGDICDRLVRILRRYLHVKQMVIGSHELRERLNNALPCRL